MEKGESGGSCPGRLFLSRAEAFRHFGGFVIINGSNRQRVIIDLLSIIIKNGFFVTNKFVASKSIWIF